MPNNIAMNLNRQKVKVLGTSPEVKYHYVNIVALTMFLRFHVFRFQSIDKAENRFHFSRLCGDIKGKFLTK